MIEKKKNEMVIDVRTVTGLLNTLISLVRKIKETMSPPICSYSEISRKKRKIYLLIQ